MSELSEDTASPEVKALREAASPEGIALGETASPEVRVLFDVVINGEEQYSLWPADSPPPAGWRAVGVRGSKTECLDHIERVWTDMRPRSLRERTR